jgi:hypothetical protein
MLFDIVALPKKYQSGVNLHAFLRVLVCCTHNLSYLH